MELDVSLSDSRFWQVAIRLKHYFVSYEPEEEVVANYESSQLST
jgi:hypothetical protein